MARMILALLVGIPAIIGIVVWVWFGFEFLNALARFTGH